MGKSHNVDLDVARVKAIRADRNLSQKGLAAASGLSIGMIGLLEIGDRKPSVCTAQAIADALGVSLNEIATVG